MFRSASTRQSELAERRFHAHMDHWKWTADQWFDGTVASVDERIAKLDNVILFARDVASRLGSTGAGFLCGNALPNLEHSRRELAAVRDSLLNGFSDRQAGARTPADRRTAKVAALDPGSDINDYSDPGWGTQGDYELGGGPSAGNIYALPSGPHAGSLQRAITLGSRDFLADQNTTDREELLIRARRYAADETSTLPTPVAHQVAAAFVGTVEELIARRPRIRQASRPVTAYEDFDDQLIY